MALSLRSQKTLLELFEKVLSGELQLGKYFNMEVLGERFRPILSHQLGIVEPEIEKEDETK